MITIIAACDEECGIGKNGDIPWKCPEDMQHFKDITWDRLVIMGRKTWDSLPKKPLPHRTNIVLSKNGCLPGFANGYDVFICHNIYSVLNLVSGGVPVVIGGANVYEQFLELDLVDYILLTVIKGKYDCDTFFPDLYENRWLLYNEEKLSDMATVLYFERQR